MNKQDKKTLKKMLPIIPLTVGALYGGGLLSQLIRNYEEWKASGGAMGDGTGPGLPSVQISTCMKEAFAMPYGIIGIALCVAALAIITFMIMKMGNRDGTVLDRERNFEYSNKGTYGTAGYMTDKEAKKVFDISPIKDNTGIILGEYNGKPLFLPAETFMNKNVAVFGASGSMKSRAYVRNYIFQATRRNESFVITDPKSEIYEDMAKFLKDEGYDVKVFNLVSPENSDSWNCISDIGGDDLMAQTFADVVIKNTAIGMGDEFWDNASINLLKALVLYVSNEYEPEKRNFGEAYKLISVMSAEQLDAMFSKLDFMHPAFAPYNLFKQASENVRSGTIIGLGAKLQVFQNEMIRNITAYDEINLADAGKRKSAYFCITSDQDSTFNFLASLFFSFLFIKLVRFADRCGNGGKLPVPVNFVLDEFPNIGAIPDIKKKISTVRSRSINISVIFQNIAQLQNRYPDGAWQEILGNCDTQLFLGCTDQETAKYISDRTGDVTVAVASKTKNLNTWRVSDYTPEYREARSIGKRKLLTPDEVLRLPIEQALVIMRGQNVLKVEKFDYTKHPFAKLLVKERASLHIPNWRQTNPEESIIIEPKKPINNKGNDINSTQDHKSYEELSREDNDNKKSEIKSPKDVPKEIINGSQKPKKDIVNGLLDDEGGDDDATSSQSYRVENKRI